MRIAFITTTYPRTATDPQGHFIARMAEGIAALGVDVSVRAPHEAGAAEYEVRNGVTVHRFHYASDANERVAYGSGIVSNMVREPRALLAFPGFVRALRKAAREAAREVDLLHVHWSQIAYVAGAGSLGVPMVLTVHGSDVQLACKRPFARTLSRPAAQAAAVIAVSEDLAALTAHALPAGREIDVVHVGVDADLLELPAPELRAIEDAAEVLLAARLVTEKGVNEFVDALALLAQEGRAIHATVLGVGPARASMEARLAEVGLANEVEFLGAIPHERALELMRASDLVVMPSHREGCGLVPIEASALGVPVVATRTGAMPEVLGCPESLVEPRDPEALAAAIERLLADVELRRTCARNGRDRVREEFTWAHIAEQNVAVYERVLAARGEAAS